MATFDPLTLLEHVLNESGGNILALLLFIFGVLLVWVGLKKKVF